MRRRHFLVLGTALLAGCSGDGSSNTDDGSDGGDFDADITFESCSTVVVDADAEYGAVALALANGSTEMREEGYEGRNTFESDGTVEEVVVWSDDGKASDLRPDGQECTGPE